MRDETLWRKFSFSETAFSEDSTKSLLSKRPCLDGKGFFFKDFVSKTGKGLRSRPNIMKKVPTLQHFCWDHQGSGYGKDPRNSGFVKTSVWCHFKTHHGFQEFRLTFVNAVTDNYLQKDNALVIFLTIFTRTPKRGHIIFTDECVIYRRWKSRNFYLRSKGNPFLFEEGLQRISPRVLIWTGISPGHWFGPQFFEGPEKRYLLAHVVSLVDGANRTHESYW
jgi:hypothetical protein